MRSANKALLLMVAVSLLGAWGCSQGGGSQNSARVRDLESRYAKLEEDHRATLAARDEARKSLSAAEQERARLRQQVSALQLAATERDELRQQVARLTSERDGFQGQLQQFAKELQGLLGKIEAAASAPAQGPPLTSAVGPPLPPRS